MIRKLIWGLLLLPSIPLLLAWNRFIVPSGTRVSDIMITHYPNLLFIQRSILNGNGIPLWSPLILGGYPLSANPLSTLWYPPVWIALLFPLPLGIYLVMAVHLVIGCFGMAFLLKQLRQNEFIIWFGALIYGLLPVGYAHIVGGHFTWVCASAWFPWLIAFSENQESRITRQVALTGGAIGLMMLADLRFSAYAILIWVAKNCWTETGKKQESRRGLGSNILKVVVPLFLGLMVSTIIWLPLIEFTGLSTRSLMTTKDTLNYSLPVFSLIGVLFPGEPETIEWVIYLGTGLFIPLLYSTSIFKKHQTIIFWWAVIIIGIVWSLGEALPINFFLAELPGISLLRVPPRVIYFASFAILTIATIALNDLVNREILNVKVFRLGIVGFVVFALITKIGIGIFNPTNGYVFYINLIITFSIGILFLLFTYSKIDKGIFIILFGVTTILDLMVFNVGLITYLSLEDVLAEGNTETQYLKTAGDDFRVYAPAYSIPQQTSAFAGLEMVGGIDPMQITKYVDFVLSASDIWTTGYSVTMPPFPTGNPIIDTIEAKPDAETLGLLNTRFLISPNSIVDDRWKLEYQTKTNLIYSNKYARGWAWVEPTLSREEANYSVIKDIIRYPNEISLHASGPGELVLSEINYPGWQAYVDGTPVDIQPAHKILRSIELPAGFHDIKFVYFPRLIVIGGLFSLIGLGISIWFLLGKAKTK